MREERERGAIARTEARSVCDERGPGHGRLAQARRVRGGRKPAWSVCDQRESDGARRTDQKVGGERKGRGVYNERKAVVFAANLRPEGLRRAWGRERVRRTETLGSS